MDCCNNCTSPFKERASLISGNILTEPADKSLCICAHCGTIYYYTKAHGRQLVDLEWEKQLYEKYPVPMRVLYQARHTIYCRILNN